MREITIKIYKFDELDEEMQESLIEQARSEMDLADEIEVLLDESLANQGLKSITVETFSIGDEETPDHIYLSGQLTPEDLEVFKSNPEADHFHMITNVFLDSEDATDDNPSGISLFVKEDIDDESEEVINLMAFFIQKFGQIEESLVEEAQSHSSKRYQEMDKKIKSKLSQNEYFQDGTLFDSELME